MKKICFAVLVLLGLQLFLLMNLKFTAWPEMFSYAYLKNNGFMLYKDVIQPYPVALILALSYVYRIFGYGVGVLKSFSWVLILFSSLAVFWASWEFSKSKVAALCSLGIYVVLQPFLDGNMLWFDGAIVLPTVLGFVFLLRWIDKGGAGLDILLVGLFLGAASLVKQTAGIFLVLVFLFLFFRKAGLKNLFYFCLGPFFLWFVFLGRVFQEGQIKYFWNWTFLYPLTKWSDFPGYVQMSVSFREAAVLVFLLVPVLGLLLLQRQVVFERKFQILLMFLAGGLVAIYPRFSFFHFQLVVAFLAVGYGCVICSLREWQRVVLIVAFFAFLAPFVFRPVLVGNWRKEARFFGAQDVARARKIEEIVPVGETTYLLGLHSGLYSMSGRVPPKPWVDNFGWYLEIPGVQEEIISRWEENRPSYVFWREPSQGNWFDLGVYQPKKITQWVENNYTRDGEVGGGVGVWRLDK